MAHFLFRRLTYSTDGGCEAVVPRLLADVLLYFAEVLSVCVSLNRRTPNFDAGKATRKDIW
jgi:hypothetical protein